jgi:UPF0755 protein
MPRSLRNVLLVLVLIGGAAGLSLRKLHDQALQSADLTEAVTFKVEPGASLRGTLSRLHAQGLLPHPRLFEAWIRLQRWQRGLALPAVRKGKYLIEPGADPASIIEQFEQGKVILEQFTLVEGWNFNQVRGALSALTVVTRPLAGRDEAAVMAALGRKGQNAEGRFAPDSYRFAEDTPDIDVLRMALGAQDQRLAQAWETRESGLPLASPEEALVLASIVEKETGLASERPRIAGVFLNRLRKGMRLQSDPTVIYGLRDRYDGNIHARDLRQDTPWNTYTRAGLPPTPIAMPGKDALQAVTHPEHTDALYFVALADGSGGHRFSATLAQHNEAVKRYLQRLKATGGKP